MVFHVGCPITCRKICCCTLGFHPALQSDSAKNDSLREVHQLEEFLRDPWGFRDRAKHGTVQVPVPKLVAPPPPAPVARDGNVGSVDEEGMPHSARTKRAALQKKAAATVVVAEDYARRFEAGDLTGGASRDEAGEDQCLSNANVLCRMCSFGETKGSERARKMLPCRSCGKKYHRSCIKKWARHRDLFHWSSWTCPSCRICEVCQRTGDPNKFMFCRRCDAAYHCYCQHPPHKNVGYGPYLCSKHTCCHSCGSNVPGNGLSVRWFLGYTCCDACGRLFVKGNYCPVCLKVYRDSESTPMVCCDFCQRWVHCQCDGISDEKYQQFQDDSSLQYKCATCRGEAYQVKNIEDAVQELWRRKDEADRDLISSLRAAAGLPTQEEIFSISPYSDDEDNSPVSSKNESGRPIKFLVKELISPKKSKKKGNKSSTKNYSKKKGSQAYLVGEAEQTESFLVHDAQSLQDSLGDEKNDVVQSNRIEDLNTISSPAPGGVSSAEGKFSANQPRVLKHKFIDEVMVSNENRTPTLKIRSNKPQVSDGVDDFGSLASNAKSLMMKKLVINIGPRKVNVANSSNSDSSSCQREHDLMALNGDRIDHAAQVKALNLAEGDRNSIKHDKVQLEFDESKPAGVHQGHLRDLLEKGRLEASKVTRGLSDAPTSRGQKIGMQSKGWSHLHGETNNDYCSHNSQPLAEDSRPLLKLKFKNPQSGNQNPQGPHGEVLYDVYKSQEEEKTSLKGQRSKRKRLSCVVDKSTLDVNVDNTQSHNDRLMDEIMDANWILKKLGKDGIGKRVEVHQSYDNLWHRGVVADVVEGTSTLYVSLDEGGVTCLQLGKQGVRFVTQKQRRS